jgi:hypothetical protein
MNRSQDRVTALERRLELLAREISGLPVTRARAGGGGPSTTSRSKFAIVRVEAAANGSSIGEAELLDGDMQPTASGSVDYIEFKSAHDVRCLVDVRVILHSSDPIAPGSNWPDNKVWATIVNGRDYLFALDAAGPIKSLGFPEGGSQATDINWLGGECVGGP